MPLENTYKLFIQLQIGEYVYISIHKCLYIHIYIDMIYVFLYVVLGNGAPDADFYVCVWSTATSASRNLFLGFLAVSSALYLIESPVPFGCLLGCPLYGHWFSGVPCTATLLESQFHYITSLCPQSSLLEIFPSQLTLQTAAWICCYDLLWAHAQFPGGHYNEYQFCAGKMTPGFCCWWWSFTI